MLINGTWYFGPIIGANKYKVVLLHKTDKIICNVPKVQSGQDLKVSLRDPHSNLNKELAFWNLVYLLQKEEGGWLTGFKPVAPGSLGTLIWILRSLSQALQLSEIQYLYVDNDYTNQLDILAIRISPSFTYTFKCVIVSSHHVSQVESMPTCSFSMQYQL